MVAVFASRYAVAVTLVFHRDWAALPAFTCLIGAGYGALSGLLASRALAILGSAGGSRVTGLSVAPVAR